MVPCKCRDGCDFTDEGVPATSPSQSSPSASRIARKRRPNARARASPIPVTADDWGGTGGAEEISAGGRRRISDRSAAHTNRTDATPHFLRDHDCPDTHSTRQMSAALSSFAAELAVTLPAEGQWKCMTAGVGASILPLAPAAAAVAHDRVACVAMLLCERDRHVMRKVLQHLEDALKEMLQPHAETLVTDSAEAPLSSASGAVSPPSSPSGASAHASRPPVAVDLLISLRASDLFCWRALLHFRPRSVRHVWLRVCEPYDSQSFVDRNGLYHTDGVLDAILLQRNALRSFAADQKFEWLFWLDSDILLRADTLALAVKTGLPCVGSHYQPRWAMHSVVAVAHSPGRTQPSRSHTKSDGATEEQERTEQQNQERLAQSECEVQLLIDPHLLAPSPSHPALAHPCVVLGFGALLVRRSLLSIEYALAESLGGVKGEDVGFCLSLLRLQESRVRARSESCRDLRRLDCQVLECPDEPDVRPHFLAGHIVQHLAGGKGTTVKPVRGDGGVNTTFVPLIHRPPIRASQGSGAPAQVLPLPDSPPSASSSAVGSSPSYAMLTRVRADQVFSLEAHVQVAWECVAPANTTEADLQEIQREMSGPGFYAHVASEQLKSSSPPPLDATVAATPEAGVSSSSSLVRLPAPVLLQPLHHFPLSCSRMLSSAEAAMSTTVVAKEPQTDSSDEEI